MPGCKPYGLPLDASSATASDPGPLRGSEVDGGAAEHALAELVEAGKTGEKVGDRRAQERLKFGDGATGLGGVDESKDGGL